MAVQTRSRSSASALPESPAARLRRPEAEAVVDDGPVVEEREQPPLRPLHRRLLHWGPLLALGVISEVTMATLVCHLEWWSPAKGLLPALNLMVFLLWSFATISHLFDAAHSGPGYVPFGWAPEDPADRPRLQFCAICKSYKAPRSHHCRKCGRCVKKMDHHCPWINNCVGYNNQPSFIKFLAFAVIGCTHSLFILGPAIYRAVFKNWHMYYNIEPIVDLTIYSLLAAIFGFGLAVGVALSVGFLFYVQMASVCRNRTGIEDYILKKAAAIRRKRKTTFAYPYAVGWRRALSDVFTWTGRPAGDGVWWSVVDGATQFTLSEEQLRQKAVKRRNAVRYVAARAYAGRVITFAHGLRTCLCTPWSDEPRLALKPHDHILVTRWAKAWLYGEKVDDIADSEKPSEGEGKGERGWFPESVARNIDEMLDEDEYEGEDVIQGEDGPAETDA